MTAIGVVGLPDGLVIGADGRMTRDDDSKPVADDASGFQGEAAQKIFQIVESDKALAWAISGFITLDDFRLLEEVKRKTSWLSKRKFDSCKKYLMAVAQRVTEEINEAKHLNKIKNFPTTRKSERPGIWKIADIVLGGYFTRIPSLGIAQISHDGTNEAECHVNFYDFNYSMLLGSEAVRKAIYPDEGNDPDPRFAQYRRSPIRSLDDAEEYIKGYIAACSSDLGRELDPEQWRITGGRLHMAKITPQNGFEWLIPPETKEQ
jgi:hypothetical protein